MSTRAETAYIAQCEAGIWPIKIGRTVDVASRLASFRTHNPFEIRLLATMRGGMETEDDMKRVFHAYRWRHEWYRPAPLIFEYIEQKRSAGLLLDGYGERPQQVPEYSAFIDALGGTGVVASELGLKPPVVSNWRVRGVAHQHRVNLLSLAMRKGVAVPGWLSGARAA